MRLIGEIMGEVLQDLKTKIKKDEDENRREKNLKQINEIIDMQRAQASREAQSKV